MKIVNKAEFENEVKEGLVLVDFFANWCGPCKMLSPVLEDLSEELAGEAKILKVNVDEEEDLAREFRVMSIPHLILFKDGKPVKQTQGFQPKEALKRFILG